MADINVTLTNAANLQTTVSNTPVINVSSGTAEVNVTLTDSANLQATVSNTPVINIQMLGSGPPGPEGPAGGSSVTYPAGENLSSGRVVVIDGGEAFYFQPADVTHAGRAFGITTSSATTGNNVTIQIAGEISDGGISAAADAVVWVGTNGQITTVAPASGILQQAGMGITATKIKIQFSCLIMQN